MTHDPAHRPHRSHRLLLLAAGLAAAATTGLAQTPPARAGAAARPAASAPATAKVGDNTLFLELGGADGLERLMADLVQRLAADPRIAEQFANTNLAGLKEQLVSQICMLSGGGCVYKGANMQAAHADMQIGKHHFNAMVEDLQLAMDAQGIPFSSQNRLLALLAPMHRDVITVR